MLGLCDTGLLHLAGLGVFLEILWFACLCFGFIVGAAFSWFLGLGCVLPLRVSAALSLVIWLVAGFVVGDRWVWLVLLCGLSGLSLDLGFDVGLYNTGLLGLVLASSLVLGAFV